MPETWWTSFLEGSLVCIYRFYQYITAIFKEYHPTNNKSKPGKEDARCCSNYVEKNDKILVKTGS